MINELTDSTIYRHWILDNEIILKKARALIHHNNIIINETFICYVCRKPKTGNKNKPFWYKKSKAANVCDECYIRIYQKHIEAK